MSEEILYQGTASDSVGAARFGPRSALLPATLRENEIRFSWSVGPGRRWRRGEAAREAERPDHEEPGPGESGLHRRNGADPGQSPRQLSPTHTPGYCDEFQAVSTRVRTSNRRRKRHPVSPAPAFRGPAG